MGYPVSKWWESTLIFDGFLRFFPVIGEIPIPCVRKHMCGDGVLFDLYIQSSAALTSKIIDHMRSKSKRNSIFNSLAVTRKMATFKVTY